jgi:SAM-dependent methyltransferase
MMKDDVKKAEGMKILSVGDGPGEPGIFMAAKYPNSTVTSSDMLPPMVEGIKKRIAAKEADGTLEPKGRVTAEIIDMLDLSKIPDASVDLLTSAHAYPFASDQDKALNEAMRVLKPGGVFGAVVWKNFELLPLAGACMGAVTGNPPQPPAPGSPPPPPLAWADPANTEALLKKAGFDVGDQSEDEIAITLDDASDIAMKYCALPIWDKIAGMEADGSVPDAWKKYAEAWPKIAMEKGHLQKDDSGNPDFAKGFSIKGNYRTVVAKKP